MLIECPTIERSIYNKQICTQKWINDNTHVHISLYVCTSKSIRPNWQQSCVLYELGIIYRKSLLYEPNVSSDNKMFSINKIK